MIDFTPVVHFFWGVTVVTSDFSSVSCPFLLFTNETSKHEVTQTDRHSVAAEPEFMLHQEVPDHKRY